MAVRSIVAAATVGLPVIGARLRKGKGGVGLGAVAVSVEAAAYTRHWFVCRYRVALLVLLVGAIGGRGHDGDVLEEGIVMQGFYPWMGRVIMS